MIGIPIAMQKPPTASAMEYALLSIMAGAFTTTLFVTIVVFLGGNFGTVGRFLDQMLIGTS